MSRTRPNLKPEEAEQKIVDHKTHSTNPWVQIVKQETQMAKKMMEQEAVTWYSEMALGAPDLRTTTGSGIKEWAWRENESVGSLYTVKLMDEHWTALKWIINETAQLSLWIWIWTLKYQRSFVGEEIRPTSSNVSCISSECLDLEQY